MTSFRLFPKIPSRLLWLFVPLSLWWSIASTGNAQPGPGADAADSSDSPAPTDQEVNFNYFHDQLAPYGTWVQVGGYGWCWRPVAAVNADPDWRPYYDMGQWVYTENGWFWESDYNWGDIPFHYGNWTSVPGQGWMWVPGYTWGPSWVFWREAEADGCIGWAPLPPGAVFVDGGWVFHGVHYGIGFDFGLDEDCFVFVGCDHFHDDFFRMRGIEYGYHISRERIHEFYRKSVVRNNFRRDTRGRLVNDGIGRQRLEHLTQRREEQVRFQERKPEVRSSGSEARSQTRVAEARQSRSEEVRSQTHTEGVRSQEARPESHPIETANKVYRPPVENQRIAPAGNFQPRKY